ncbi:MAG: molybdenum cofactor guanylyltransferase MobA [Paracoccus sp. (in: a-proteobacteria)]|uniref:molybdenum cofactor guanylyltransferase MobA n=1 Tax=Paracoccus sp. TaxID=267 RepID=UPI0026DEDC52|nr:molybdenum cofactor guanylyltransferase MobA [Paracoccus sp. (in: a-proteobacteria)]MDO5622089.1 molybdenum cofactor guanylyltransferase MobA [Paracoccus sp. (in: a-proteobacteria)]
MTPIPAMILAGGRATRMGGGDKGLRLLNGQPLIAHVITRLTPQCGPLAINANGDPARLEHLGLPIQPDSIPGQPGPLAGILAAMDWAAGLGAAAVVTAAADTPFLPLDLIPRLQAAGPLAIAASPDDSGQLRFHPTFGLWPTHLRDDLRRAIANGTRRPRLWADPHGLQLVHFDSQPLDPFFNINTPDDLARAERLSSSV